MLKDYRKKIDQLNIEILKLLNERTRLVLDIGRIKTKNKAEFYAPDRERQIYKRLEAANKGPFPNSALRNVFREIMSASLSLEKPVKIAFLGPIATFTHQACTQHFGLSGHFLPKNDIADVFVDVEKGRADFGVVPIENTAEGVVTHTLDTFVTSPLKISAEIMLEVSLSIMNKSGKMEDVSRVCSHAHALAQCKHWLKKNLPDVVLTDVTSTARAAEIAGEDGSAAAISSAAAADIYDLRIIERSIEDSAHNFTRFLVIGKEIGKKTGTDKTSLVFAIKDFPGALYKMLKSFASRGLNMTKIESRPLKTKAWEYVFFVDLDGHITDKPVKEAVSELDAVCSFVKILGSYPKSWPPS
jgi:chorismate mutase/prephenate dehydratase